MCYVYTPKNMLGQMKPLFSLCGHLGQQTLNFNFSVFSLVANINVNTVYVYSFLFKPDFEMKINLMDE